MCLGETSRNLHQPNSAGIGVISTPLPGPLLVRGGEGEKNWWDVLPRVARASRPWAILFCSVGALVRLRVSAPAARHLCSSPAGKSASSVSAATSTTMPLRRSFELAGVRKATKISPRWGWAAPAESHHGGARQESGPDGPSARRRADGAAHRPYQGSIPFCSVEALGRVRVSESLRWRVFGESPNRTIGIISTLHPKPSPPG